MSAIISYSLNCSSLNPKPNISPLPNLIKIVQNWAWISSSTIDSLRWISKPIQQQQTKGKQKETEPIKRNFSFFSSFTELLENWKEFSSSFDLKVIQLELLCFLLHRTVNVVWIWRFLLIRLDLFFVLDGLFFLQTFGSGPFFFLLNISFLLCFFLDEKCENQPERSEQSTQQQIRESTDDHELIRSTLQSWNFHIASSQPATLSRIFVLFVCLSVNFVGVFVCLWLCECDIAWFSTGISIEYIHI